MKEEFLKLKTYEEFLERRKEFKNLKFDKEIIEHMGKIFPKLKTNGINPDGTHEELYPTPPKKTGDE